MIYRNSSTNVDTEFRDAVIAGLSTKRKTLPCKYFYDRQGSELFDQICELDAYYPTRTEVAILRDNIARISTVIGTDASLIELGSGSSDKTRILLDNVADLSAYVPIDISGEYLSGVVDRLQLDYPDLEIRPLAADFTQPIEVNWSDWLPRHDRRVAFFPGSTIGNFEPAAASQLLDNVRGWLEQCDGLLIGVDLQKDIRILETAYDDPQGVTAAFNLNLLTRINRELNANFDEAKFVHEARYDRTLNRIEMLLVSQAVQTVSIDEHEFQFEVGETICTEHSHKYTLEQFKHLALLSGFKCRQVWQDINKYFAVIYFDAN